MTEVNDVMLKVDLEENGGSLSFDTLEEIQAWILEQRSLYEWSLKLNRAPVNQTWFRINQIFTPITQQVTAAINNKRNNAAFDGNLQQIEILLKTSYLVKKEIYVSSHPNFQFIEKLREEGDEVAAVALGQLINANVYHDGMKSTVHLRAGLESILFELGYSDKTFESEKEALTELAGKWESELDSYKTKLNSLEGEFQATDENIKKFFSAKSTEAEEFYEKNEKDLSDLKQTYNQYMALKAPVEYWEEKRVYHKEVAPKLKNWSVGVGVIGGGILSLLAYNMLEADKPEVWKVALLVIIGTLLFWGLRILVRLYLSHVHLEADARERVVMTKTYLALVRDESGIEEGDKNLILSTLFRPTSTGVIKDDGIPPGVYDLVTKFGTR